MNTLTSSLVPLILMLPIYITDGCEPEPPPDFDEDGVTADVDCDDYNAAVGEADWTVGEEGQDFLDIQSAVDAATDGDFICVRAGNYPSGIVIDKSLTVWAGDRDAETIIEGSASGRAVTIVDAPDVTLNGFIIRGATATEADIGPLSGGGVLVLDSPGAWIADNYIHGNWVRLPAGVAGSVQSREGLGGGIAVFGSEVTRVTGNTVVDNHAWIGAGIALAQGSNGSALHNNELAINIAEDSGGGFGVFTSNDVELSVNRVYGNVAANGGGVAIEGLTGIDIYENDISDNSADELGGGMSIYLTDHVTLSENIINRNVTTGEDVAHGGAMSIIGVNDVRVTGGELSDNQARVGGAVYVTDASPVTFEALTMSGNSASDVPGGAGGGGVFAHDVDVLALNQVQFLENYGGEGGAVKIGGDCRLTPTMEVTVRGGLFQGNDAAYHGGGLYSACAMLLTIEDEAVFLDNHSAANGGAVFAYGNAELALIGGRYEGNSSDMGGAVRIMATAGPTFVRRVNFVDNQGHSDGGGLAIEEGYDLEVTDVTFTGNIAANQGGGLALWGVQGVTTITDTRFINNGSDHRGAGVHLGDSASASFTGSTFEGNSAEIGGGLMCSHTQGQGYFTIEATDFSGNAPEDTACDGCGTDGPWCN